MSTSTVCLRRFDVCCVVSIYLTLHGRAKRWKYPSGLHSALLKISLMALESLALRVCGYSLAGNATHEGWAGAFRIACEVTLQLLRDNKDSLMSVLDAFIHDPLVEWEDEKRKLVSPGRSRVLSITTTM